VKKSICLLILSILILMISNVAAETEKDIVKLRFGRYLTLLKRGQFDLATSLWLDDYVSEVYKFGISYNEVPIKFDCNSPLVLNIDEYRSGKARVDFDVINRAIGEYNVNLKITVGGEESFYRYTLIRDEDARFYLAPRFWSLLMAMKTVEGKYYKLYYFRDRQINDSALAALDKKIEELAAMIGLDPDALERIADDKLSYVLCENLIQAKELSGVTEPGWHDPASNFIITSYLPHPGVLADFLITYKLRECSLYTLPFMEKGLPVFLGGRGGARLSVFGQLIDFSLKSDFLKPADILNAAEFVDKTGGPDFAYALSGYFNGYLHDLLGMDKMLALYLRLSGDRMFIDTCSGEMVKAALKDISGKSWDELENDFLAYFEKQWSYGIYPFEGQPGGEIIFQSGTSKFKLDVYDDGDKYIFDAKSFEDSGAIYGALMFHYNSSQYDSEYESSLYEKHFSSNYYDKQFYGIIFCQDEVGTYNYLTNEITAKYISSLTEKSAAFEPGHITFSIEKELIPRLELVEMP
jgi:hypothetical protein